MNQVGNHLKAFLVIVFLILSLNGIYGQQYNLKAFDIERVRLKKIVEWTVIIDSANKRKDSSQTVYIFDSLGRIVEKQYDFYRTKSLFTSIKYFYNQENFLFKTLYNNPSNFETYNLIDPPDSTEFIVYEYNNRIKRKVNTWKTRTLTDSHVEELDYTYGNLYLKNGKEYVYFNAAGFLRIYKYKQVRQNMDNCLQDDQGNIFCDAWCTNLIDFIDLKKNGLLVSQTRFEYYF